MANITSAWKYYSKVTIDNTGNASALTNYQVSISLTSANFDFTRANSDGSDIRFTDSDKTTLLNYWIESYDSVGQTAKIWVKVPSIPASSTKDIWMYYGNAGAVSASDKTATFIDVIAGTQLALTFDEGAGTVAYDKSGNGNNGTLYNGVAWTTSGKFNDALSFDGVDDYVDLTSRNFPTGNSARTVEGWFTAGNNNAQSFLDYGTSAAGERFSITAGNTTIAVAFSGHNWGIDTLNLTGWHHISVVYPSGATTSDQGKIYLDGIEQSLYTLAGSPVTVNTIIAYALIGTNGRYNAFQNGSIDEVRIYNTALTPTQILNLYNNYGYNTPNNPNETLVRQYTSPEPTASVGFIQSNRHPLLFSNNF